ncbi:MAG: hypothetical protein JMDDDDMK_02603 [Acidobacteria bacterium]|nr:hypothetical protein [Acidobacteriota bacterium]
MLVGVNYPWIDYAWDFGDPPSAWVNPQHAAEWREKKRKQIADDFRAFAEMGLFAVRWFMLADGLSYGVGDEAPRKVGGRWTFDPLPREHHFHKQLCDDFEFVLKTCAELKIKFVPSLIDFHWCHQGVVADAGANIVKGGRFDIVCDPAKSRAFFDAALEPLLEISLRYPGAIYAWELINEPEWVTETRSLMRIRPDENKTVTQDEMSAFIAEGVGRINAKRLPDGRQAFRSTVGFAHWDAIRDWDSAGLGVTLHQFHYYAPDKREIPKHNFSDEYPCFVGEFATTFHRGWPDLKKQDLARTISARLQCLDGKCYPSVFLWSARATDEATTWVDADRQETISFIRASTVGGGNDVA